LIDDRILFETPRLYLREWTVEDAPQAFEIYRDPEVTRWLGGGQPQESVETQRESLAKVIERYRQPEMAGFGFWPVFEQSTDRLVGAILLKPLPPENADIEIGWHFGRFAWGNGYATEAAREVMTYAFEKLKLDRLHAVVMPGNDRSIAVTQRLGMVAQGRTDRYYGLDLEHFTISPSEVAAQRL
jgi:RimJ/RimL family protein N-acetyltransferase